MKYPEFYNAVPGIRLRDPLAALLGATDDGIIDYRYLDAVKIAGHSCPTVASAYWLTRQALRALYGENLPERGGVRVEFSAGISDGVTGVIANVVSMLTGAAGDGGFKGLVGHFERRGLLSFRADTALEIRYTRLDGQGQIDAAANPGRVPAHPEMGALMQRCLSGVADAAEVRQFGTLWQERVRRILLDHGEDTEVFVLHSKD
ncbi:MAG: hypothetical protein PHQ05_11050 [Sterolibacterium sp.]|nr:hypothetical protein [Sterolibacterium sp.]